MTKIINLIFLCIITAIAPPVFLIMQFYLYTYGTLYYLTNHDVIKFDKTTYLIISFSMGGLSFIMTILSLVPVGQLIEKICKKISPPKETMDSSLKNRENEN